MAVLDWHVFSDIMQGMKLYCGNWRDRDARRKTK